MERISTHYLMSHFERIGITGRVLSLKLVVGFDPGCIGQNRVEKEWN
jgi:hypothetical protein